MRFVDVTYFQIDLTTNNHVIQAMVATGKQNDMKEGNVLFNDASTHFIYCYMASVIW